MPPNRISRYLTQAPSYMGRPKGVEKSKLGTWLPVDLHTAVQEFSDESGIPITRIVEDALRAYLTRQRDDKPGWMDRHHSADKKR